MSTVHCRRALLSVALLVTFMLVPGADAAKQGPSIPNGLKGFSGQLRGSVVEVARDGRGFALKVTGIGKTWKKNTAENPQQAVGMTLPIHAMPGNEYHVRFIKSLKPGEELTVEAVHKEGDRLFILELNQEQRERAGVGKDK